MALSRWAVVCAAELHLLGKRNLEHPLGEHLSLLDSL